MESIDKPKGEVGLRNIIVALLAFASSVLPGCVSGGARNKGAQGDTDNFSEIAAISAGSESAASGGADNSSLDLADVFPALRCEDLNTLRTAFAVALSEQGLNESAIRSLLSAAGAAEAAGRSKGCGVDVARK